MKKVNSLKFLILFLSLFMGSLMAHATYYDFLVDGIYYSVNSDSVTVSVTSKTELSFDNDSYSGDVVIPASVTYEGKTYTVNRIDRYAMVYCDDVTSVVLPNTITTIDDGAFASCSGLTDINIPDQVTNVGYDAFRGTPWLNAKPDGLVYVAHAAYLYKGTMPEGTSIVLDEGTTCVSGHAFQYCKGLVSISIPNTVTFFGERAFCGCTNLGEIVIPESVVSLGWAGFEGCTGLTSVSIPSTLGTIDPRAFADCINLSSVTINDGLDSIDYYAFEDCRSLQSIRIPKSVMFINYGAFNGCDNLEIIEVDPENPKYDSRDNCNAVIVTASNIMVEGCKSTVIPNTVTAIGYLAFGNCRTLERLVIPSSLQQIYSQAFTGCLALESLTVDPASTTFDSRGNCNAVIETATNTLVLGCKATVIPNSVTAVGRSAFHECSTLTVLNFPEGLTSIGYQAFTGCSGLTDVVIPHTVTTISDWAFARCTNMTSIRLPDSLEAIPYCSFYECSKLTEVIIPDKVTTIGYSAFSNCSRLYKVRIPSSVTTISTNAFSSCYVMKSVTCLAPIPPKIYSSSFYYSTVRSGTLEVPYSSVNDYATAEYWSDFTNIVGIFVEGTIFEVDGIRYKVTGENTVSVTSKEESADNYSGSVNIPASVTYDEQTFNVTAIDANAFDGADELTSVKMAASVTTIGEEAFQGCVSLTNVVIGSGVTHIGAKAFNYCNALQSVTCESAVPPVMASTNCFPNKAYNQATLFVPYAFIDTYREADYWYKFNTIEGITDGVGDVNGDGNINITDVTSMISKLLSGDFIYNPYADVNNDGVVNITDVTALISNLLSM